MSLLTVKGKTYGTVEILGDDLFTAGAAKPEFELTVEPHVMLRLKRVFERIGKDSHKTAKLAATPSNARELLWFMERYPLSGSRRTLNNIRRLAEDDVARERLVTDVMSGASAPRLFNLALPPRDYQTVAAELCLRSGSLLVADELGTGKTITAICVLAAEGARPALVVTQTHLQTQWRDQILRFLPSAKPHILRKSSPYDLRTIKGGEPDVIISSYAKLNGWAESLGGKVQAFIADEAQEFRHAETAQHTPPLKYAAGKYIAERARFRMGLTATPIYGYGGEIFNVMDVIAPGKLGERHEFGREWCVGGWGPKASVQDPVAFGAWMRQEGLMIRRTRKDVGRELPGLTRVPHAIDADEHAIDLVEKDVAHLALTILKAGGGGFERMRAGGELDWKLRHATGLAKAPFVAAFARMLLESEQKLVLWAWHHDVHAILASELKDFGVSIYTGQETIKQKDDAKKRFVEEAGCRVLLMSLRAGAGLDGIQHVCRTGVVAELDWAPAVHDQCCGRLDRDGQEHPVSVYFPIAKSGSDPVIADVLGIKAWQSEGIVRGRAEGEEDIAVKEVDPNHIAKLARAILEKRGLSIPVDEEEERETA